MIRCAGPGAPAFAAGRRGYPCANYPLREEVSGWGIVSTVLIVVLAVAVVIVVAGALYMGLAKGGGGGGLRRRFGPEYDRVLARHNGDTKAAERELGLRVRTYGSFTPHPLPPEVREQYLSRWTAAQERFVESPRQALTEVHVLLGGLAQARGFPGPERHDEHVDALSVHHPHHIGGYRRLHAAATSGSAAPGTTAGTEEMREAMLQARAFFDALATERAEPVSRTARSRTAGRAPRAERPLTHDGPAHGGPAPGDPVHGGPVPGDPVPGGPDHDPGARGPLFPGRGHTKGSEAS